LLTPQARLLTLLLNQIENWQYKKDCGDGNCIMVVYGKEGDGGGDENNSKSVMTMTTTTTKLHLLCSFTTYRVQGMCCVYWTYLWLSLEMVA